METRLPVMDRHTDPATRQLLSYLISKKLKFNRYKTIHVSLLYVSAIYGMIVLYTGYKRIVIPHDYSFMHVFSAFLEKGTYHYLFLLAAGLFGAVKIMYDKKEKAEKEFHALRCEIIDRSKDLWKEEGWKQRHTIFEQMKKMYDINLYHETK